MRTINKIILTFFALIVVLTSLFLFFTKNVDAVVRVKGYYRKDGTYVAPHYRSDPDGKFYNNWSTKGNVNPFTGKKGTKTSPDYNGTGAVLYYGSEDSAPSTNCGANQYYSYTLSECRCNYGYVRDDSNQCINEIEYKRAQCVNQLGINAEYDSIYYTCKCKNGYINDNLSCISLDDYCKNKYGRDKAYYNSSEKTCKYCSGDFIVDEIADKCVCPNGYYFNAIYNQCLLNITCGENQFLGTDNKCYCKIGYELNLLGNECVKPAPCIDMINGYLGSDGKCYCNDNFIWDGVNSRCINQPDNTDSHGRGQWVYTNIKNTEILESYVTANKAVNLRDDPSLNAKIIGQLKKNIKYQVLDLTNKKWVKIKYSTSKDGWVLKRLINIY